MLVGVAEVKDDLPELPLNHAWNQQRPVALKREKVSVKQYRP
ncbi:hypothetical protein [Nodosilinea sp. LEGE 07088]|nr:hypothetical protein [Nodosilinea sp. LEGE 07088]